MLREEVDMRGLFLTPFTGGPLESSFCVHFFKILLLKVPAGALDTNPVAAFPDLPGSR